MGGGGSSSDCLFSCCCRLQAFLGVCPYPPLVVTDYCAQGSLTDVLREARASPAKAAKLSWHRRLSLVGAGASREGCWRAGHARRVQGCLLLL